MERTGKSPVGLCLAAEQQPHASPVARTEEKITAAARRTNNLNVGGPMVLFVVAVLRRTTYSVVVAVLRRTTYSEVVEQM